MKRSIGSLVVAAALIACASHAIAADMPTKARKWGSFLTDGYPNAKCGGYFGINTMGSSNAVTNGGVGTQVVQGAIGGTIGYACPLNNDGSFFWFAEGMFDFANLNGATNGIALGGPAVFEQRIAVGSPLNAMLASIIPSLGSSAQSQIPALPGLPAGVTAGPGRAYMFAAFVERDISALVGLSQNKEWLFQPGVGIGLLTPLSNKVTIDTFVEFDFATNAICAGPAPTCAVLGNGARVGVQAKY